MLSLLLAQRLPVASGVATRAAAVGGSRAGGLRKDEVTQEPAVQSREIEIEMRDYDNIPYATRRT